MAIKSKINQADIDLLKTIFATKEELENAKLEIMDQQQSFRSEFFDKIDPILNES